MRAQGEETASAAGSGLTRRGFLGRALAGVAAVGLGKQVLAAPPPPAAGGQPRPFTLEEGDDAGTGMLYRAIPACHIRISTIVSGPASAEIQERMVYRGVNYFHKVDGCGGAEFLRKLDWDYFYCDVVIDKLDREGAIQEFERRRAAAGLDLIHFFKIHATLQRPEDLDRNPQIFEAFETLRAQNKTKWLAISLHAGAEMVEACVESGRFQQIQIPFNPLHAGEAVLAALRKAQEAGIGVIAMKSMAGGPAKWQDNPRAREVLRQYWGEGRSAAQAMLKWILAQPGITAAVPHCANVQQADENCAAAGAKLAAWEKEGLEALAGALSSDYCRLCRSCEACCPRGLPVADLLRYRMYALAYGQRQGARQLYGALPGERQASACDGCGACERACPYELPVRSMLAEAHSVLA
jgi:predicted aldo/keto reductase-like oxidoreductase